MTPLSTATGREREKKLIWTNKKIIFFFNWSNCEKFVEKIGEANWWKHLMYSLYIRNLCMAIFVTPHFYFWRILAQMTTTKIHGSERIDLYLLSSTNLHLEFGLRSVWGRYVKLDSYIFAFPILDANVCASNSRYRTIFKLKISGNSIQIWVGNYQLNHV